MLAHPQYFLYTPELPPSPTDVHDFLFKEDLQAFPSLESSKTQTVEIIDSQMAFFSMVVSFLTVSPSRTIINAHILR